MASGQRPNLFIVGQPKSGTTALYHFVSQHPQVFCPPLKEPNYFCTDFHRKADRWAGPRRFYPIRTAQQYGSLYRSARQQPYCVDASVWYLVSEEAVPNIAHFNPDARLIVLLRSPVDMVVSLHKELLRGGIEDVHDVSAAVALSARRLAGQDVPSGAPFPEYVAYAQYIQYGQHLRRLFAHFPESQVFVIVFEEFRRDNGRIFRALAEWLGIDSSFQPRFQPVNQYPPGQLSWFGRWLMRPSLKSAVRRLVPVHLHDQLFDVAFRMCWRPEQAAVNDVRRQVWELLREPTQAAIEETSSLLRRRMDLIWRPPTGMEMAQLRRAG